MKTKLSENIIAKAKAKKVKDKQIKSQKAKETWVKVKEVKKQPTKKVNFDKIEQQNKKLSFEQGSEIREKHLEILSSRKQNDQIRYQKKMILKALKIEFSKTYKTYMSMKWVELKKIGKPPVSSESLKKYAQKIGKNCLESAVSPKQLLEYWDRNIEFFANIGMKYPPLTFLSSAMATEKVAITANSSKPKKSFNKNKKDRTAVNSYYESTGTESSLREALLTAGFSAVNNMSDRDLRSVQNAAETLADGCDLFVFGDVGDMARWAAENFYKKTD